MNALKLDECNVGEARLKVREQWANFTERERHEVCRECSSYFPHGYDEWDCLSGHRQHWNKPCSMFSRAVFRLVDDWEYSPFQVYALRRFEMECRRCFAGEDGFDDDD